MAGERLGRGLLGRHPGRRVLRELALLALGRHVGQRLWRAQQARAARCVGRADLRREPLPRVTRDNVERGLTEAETVCGNRRL